MAKANSHQHHWTVFGSSFPVYARGDERPHAVLQTQMCECGSVRSIEFAVGQNPVIRYTKGPEDK